MYSLTYALKGCALFTTLFNVAFALPAHGNRNDSTNNLLHGNMESASSWDDLPPFIYAWESDTYRTNKNETLPATKRSVHHPQKLSPRGVQDKDVWNDVDEAKLIAKNESLAEQYRWLLKTLSCKNKRRFQVSLARDGIHPGYYIPCDVYELKDPDWVPAWAADAHKRLYKWSNLVFLLKNFGTAKKPPRRERVPRLIMKPQHIPPSVQKLLSQNAFNGTFGEKDHLAFMPRLKKAWGHLDFTTRGLIYRLAKTHIAAARHPGFDPLGELEITAGLRWLRSFKGRTQCMARQKALLWAWYAVGGKREQQDPGRFKLYNVILNNTANRIWDSHSNRNPKHKASSSGKCNLSSSMKTKLGTRSLPTGQGSAPMWDLDNPASMEEYFNYLEELEKSRSLANGKDPFKMTSEEWEQAARELLEKDKLGELPSPEIDAAEPASSLQEPVKEATPPEELPSGLKKFFLNSWEKIKGWSKNMWNAFRSLFSKSSLPTAPGAPGEPFSIRPPPEGMDVVEWARANRLKSLPGPEPIRPVNPEVPPGEIAAEIKPSIEPPSTPLDKMYNPENPESIAKTVSRLFDETRPGGKLAESITQLDGAMESTENWALTSESDSMADSIGSMLTEEFEAGLDAVEAGTDTAQASRLAVESWLQVTESAMVPSEVSSISEGISQYSESIASSLSSLPSELTETTETGITALGLTGEGAAEAATLGTEAFVAGADTGAEVGLLTAEAGLATTGPVGIAIDGAIMAFSVALIPILSAAIDPRKEHEFKKKFLDMDGDGAVEYVQSCLDKSEANNIILRDRPDIDLHHGAGSFFKSLWNAFTASISIITDPITVHHDEMSELKYLDTAHGEVEEHWSGDIVPTYGRWKEGEGQIANILMDYTLDAHWRTVELAKWFVKNIEVHRNEHVHKPKIHGKITCETRPFHRRVVDIQWEAHDQFQTKLRVGGNFGMGSPGIGGHSTFIVSTKKTSKGLEVWFKYIKVGDKELCDDSLSPDDRHNCRPDILDHLGIASPWGHIEAGRGWRMDTESGQIEIAEELKKVPLAQNYASIPETSPDFAPNLERAENLRLQILDTMGKKASDIPPPRWLYNERLLEYKRMKAEQKAAAKEAEEELRRRIPRVCQLVEKFNGKDMYELCLRDNYGKGPFLRKSEVSHGSPIVDK